MKSLGAVVRTSNGSPPAARIASFTILATPSRWEKQIASSEEVLITAIFGFSMSASVRPSARHCARRTAQNDVPRSKLLRSFLVIEFVRFVGWVERSETHRPAAAILMGFAFAQPILHLCFLGHLDDPVVGIDLHPIAGFDHGQRVLIELGDRRSVGDDGAECDLGGH